MLARPVRCGLATVVALIMAALLPQCSSISVLRLRCLFLLSIALLCPNVLRLVCKLFLGPVNRLVDRFVLRANHVCWHAMNSLTLHVCWYAVSSLTLRVFVMQDQTAGSISSDFLYSADGWKKAGNDAARVEMLHAPMLIQGSDEGEHTWWFSAPPV